METSIVGALLAALAIVATCVGVLGWVIKFMFEKMLPAMENNNTLTAEGIEMTKANTLATKAADDYLRDRNGRDHKHHEATLNAINAIPNVLKKIARDQEKAIIQAVKVEKQSVTKQTVQNQTIKHVSEE